MIRTEMAPRKPVARDLMAELVVTVPQHMSLGGAARLLARAEVSAAPVVDGSGRCVGLLTASALVPLVASGPGTRARVFHECAWSDWQLLKDGADPSDEVWQHMAGPPPRVEPEASLTEIVRVMAAAGASRVFVVDAGGVPLGTVSATQVLAAVAPGGPALAHEVGPSVKRRRRVPVSP